MRDYPCQTEAAQENSERIRVLEDLLLPEEALCWERILAVARARREREGGRCLLLPFCHTLEAEALGAEVELGDRRVGPRIRKPRCASLSELDPLPSLDLSSGRLGAFLKAAEEAGRAGERVIFEISGPFTILSGLVESTEVYKALRRQPEILNHLLKQLEGGILRLAARLAETGTAIISYADAAGSLTILGPHFADMLARQFTGPCLRKAALLCRGKSRLHLCPKTALALLDTGQAERVDQPLSGNMAYEEVLLEAPPELVGGWLCLKQRKNCIRELKLLRLLSETEILTGAGSSALQYKEEPR